MLVWPSASNVRRYRNPYLDNNYLNTYITSGIDIR
jgi:hypothetical protein